MGYHQSAMRLATLVLSAFPAIAALPTPEAHFGHAMGADRQLVRWADVVSYFRALDAASESVRVESLGRTTEGREMILAVISDPETIGDLDAYRQILAALADPRGVSPEQVQPLLAAGKPAVSITCSIHSSEVASTMTAMQFAHDLLSVDTPRHRSILRNTILLLVPSLNPDGVDKVKAWYDRWVGTAHEGAPLPELYQKYVGHDNNRDWYIFSQRETRLMVEQVHNAWHPQVVYDVHQMGRTGARIFVPPWIDPIDPNIDPLITQQVNAFGTAMAVDLTAAGKTGVLIHAIYDYYSPARHYQSYHGALRLLSESASVRIASPLTVSPSKLDPNGQGFDARASRWNFLEPWKGGEWRLRDIVEYQLITFESVLYTASLRRADLLRNFYRIGARVIERGGESVYVVPADQHDPSAATRLLRTLQFGAVEIERVTEEPESDLAVRRGDYIVRLGQPSGSFAKTLLERQSYPDLRAYPGGPPRPPYDATAHSLPLLMGVEAFRLDRQVEAGTESVTEIAVQSGSVAPGPELLLSPAQGASWVAVSRLLAAGIPVHRRVSDGAFLLYASEAVRQLVGSLAAELDIRFDPSPEPSSDHPRMTEPRVAIYTGHAPIIDEGWTRWLLDRYEMPYESVGNAEINAGLDGHADVLILPDAKPGILAGGFDHEYGPGDSVVPPAYRGGLGESGVAAVERFVRQGGVVLAFNRAAAFVADRLDLPVQNVVAGMGRQRFFGPGTLLNVDVDLRHPLCFGMRAREAAWFEAGPVFRARQRAGSRVRTVLSYPDRDVLASGWLLGASYLASKAAVLDVSLGEGRVILFGIRPQYRGQSNATFKMVFNGLYL